YSLLQFTGVIVALYHYFFGVAPPIGSRVGWLILIPAAFNLIFGLAFVFEGLWTLRLRRNETRRNGIASIVIGVLGLGLFTLAGEQVLSVVAIVAVVIAGVLGVVGNRQYVSYRNWLKEAALEGASSRPAPPRR